MKAITAKSYTLITDSGEWLGQIVLTNDGMMAGQTDYGPLAYAWRAYGDEDFRQFIISLNVSYFGQKLVTSYAYMCHNKTMEKACHRLAEKILPALQEALKKEIESEA